MASWVWINEQLLEADKATLHYSDLAIQRGYGVFDFFRLNPQPVFLEEHLDRFYRSANALHLSLPCSREELKERIALLIGKNQMAEGGIRLTLTGGYSANGYSLARPNLMIAHQSFTPPTEEQLEKGISLLTYRYQRQLAQIKSIDYLMGVWLQPLLQEKGADEILYHHEGGVSECPRSNFFLVGQDGTVVTPAHGVLEGITREKVIGICRKHFRVETREVSLADCRSASEAFLTSTTKGVLPVAQIDGRPLPRVNFLTSKIRQAFLELRDQVVAEAPF